MLAWSSCPRAREPSLQGLDGRRKNLDRDRADILLAHLGGALPINLEQHVPPAPPPLLHEVAGSSVPVAEDASGFEHAALVRKTAKRGLLDEMVLAAVPFAVACGPRGVGHGHLDAGNALDEAANERALARPRGPRDHEEQTGGSNPRPPRRPRYSMF